MTMSKRFTVEHSIFAFATRIFTRLADFIWRRQSQPSLGRRFSAVSRAYLIVAAALCLVAASAHASCNLTVSSTADTNTSGTLRNALSCAASGDVIVFGSLFNSPQTITLTSALPTISVESSGTLSIEGPAATLLTINGAGYEAFSVSSGQVAIYGFTFTKAAPAISTSSTGSVDVTGCTFLNNSHNYGGAIYASGGYLIAAFNTFIGNTATNGGGAIEYTGTSDGSVTDNTFYQNSVTGATGKGGAIDIGNGADAGIANNTFAGNSAYQGGAVNSASTPSSDMSYVENNIFYQNSATESTIYNSGYTTSDHNLFYENTATSDANTCGTCSVNTSVITTDPKLMPLGYYGNSTEVMLLLPGSGAICAGITADDYYIADDQRGSPLDPNCSSSSIIDVGSIQTNQFLVNVSTDDSPGTKSNCEPSSTSKSCTLRDAVLAANTAGQGDITFALSLSGSTITLATSPLQELNDGPSQINILGPGAPNLTISGNNNASVGSVFYVDEGGVLFIYGVTISNGTGTIYANAGYGGGIYDEGILTVSNSAIINNTVNPNVTNPYSDGGGIYMNSGTLTIVDSTISGNSVSTSGSGKGGGIETAEVGTVTIINSTISGNSATEWGGGIADDGGTVNLYNATVSNNQAIDAGDAGGIWQGGGTLTLDNTIVDGNTAGTNNDYDNYESEGTLVSNDSLVGTGTSNLGALANYGGPTQTMLPLPGSGAICTGVRANIYPGTTTDQRGFLNKNGTYTGYTVTPCVDAGADQTNYTAVNFVQQPTGAGVSSPITPAPTVDVIESGNQINGVPLTVDLAVGSGTLGGTLTQTTSGGVATFSGLTINTAGTGDELGVSLTVSPSGASNVITLTTDSSPFDIAGSLSKLVVAAPSTAEAGQSFNFTVTAEDSGGDTVTGYTGTVSFTSTDSLATLPGSYTFTSGDAGVHTFSATLVTLGGQTITAHDTGNSLVATSNTITVGPGLANYLKVTGYPSPVYQYTTNTGTVTAYDQFNNVATGFTGPVTISSSTDGTATITQPSSWTNGAATFTVAFDKTGTQSITASGTSLTSGSQTGIVVNAPPSYVVTTTSDDTTGVPANCPVNNSPTSTDCSLRDALAAVAGAGSGNITFSSTVFATAQTITLGTGGTLTIRQNATITGATSGSGITLKNLVTVSGAGSYGVFSVGSGVNGTSITGLNIVNGNTTHGGGINNDGTLTVSNSMVNGNSTANTGGGIYNDGTLTVNNSTISDNAATDYGGGIFNDNAGTLTVNNSTFSGNSVSLSGGAIDNLATLTVNDSTISGNTATTGDGGGIYTAGSLTIGNSIVSGNTAPANATFDDLYNSATQINLDGNQLGVSGIDLAPLGNYGGPTQTMVALPGSPAICGGLTTNIQSGIATDQRGNPRTTTTYGTGTCVDSGATQSAYSLSFTTSPSSTQQIGVAFTPSPAVTLYDDGVAIDLSGVSIAITANAGTLSGTTTQTTNGSGVATFGGLSIGQTELNDYLTATATVYSSNTITANSSDFSVGKLSQTITFDPSITTIPYSPTGFTVSATASSGLTVSFTSMTLSVCTVSGTTVSTLTTGQCSIVASQAGNGTYNAAPTVTVNFTIVKAAQTITFDPSVTTVPYSPTGFTVSATASSGLTVSFASTTLSVCTVSGMTVSTLETGQCTIVASQAGNADYNAATPVTVNFTIVKASQTINFSPAITTYPYSLHGTFTVSATATSGLTVSFASSTTGVCTMVGTNVYIVTTGTCSIVATQAGNADYNAAPAVTVNFTIAKATQEIVFLQAHNSYVYTPGAEFSISAVASSGLQVSFSTTTPTVCTISSGTVVEILSAGNCVVEATQAGNADYAAAYPVLNNYDILGASTSTTLSASSQSVTAGQSVTLTATVTSSTKGTLTGSVSFYDGTTLLGTVTLSNGSTALPISTLASGVTHSITAEYSGNTDFLSSVSAAVKITVAQ
jgi:hypothetical protein